MDGGTHQWSSCFALTAVDFPVTHVCERTPSDAEHGAIHHRLSVLLSYTELVCIGQILFPQHPHEQCVKREAVLDVFSIAISFVVWLFSPAVLLPVWFSFS